MCIRDSSPGDLLVGHGSAITAVAGGAVADLAEKAPEGDVICLLYTSDAADERSSVDLGGRRIIKKKNTGDTRCCRREQKQKNKRDKVQE